MTIKINIYTVQCEFECTISLGTASRENPSHALPVSVDISTATVEGPTCHEIVILQIELMLHNPNEEGVGAFQCVPSSASAGSDPMEHFRIEIFLR